MTKYYWICLIVVGMAVVGCEEPVIVPTGVPGVEPTKVVPVTDAGSEAIGEVPKGHIASTLPPKPDIPPAPPTAKGEIKKTKSGVEYETLREGTGPEARAGQKVTVHYTGTLEDGTKFDSSRDRREPSTFEIGTGAVIRGWDEAIPGMKVGERRYLKVPSNAGYGPAGQLPMIPPNAALNFDVELLGVK